jgi:hypothetical protein
VAYEIRATLEFREWMQTLSLEERESFDTSVNLLREKGPVLARPYVDTVKGSAFPNMKELRTAHGKHLALRAFFAFDPQRAAILLIGGDKHGRRGFYEKLIRKADELYREHLRVLKSKRQPALATRERTLWQTRLSPTTASPTS